jgi:succinate dehydrogenase flavoprotein subunit
VFFLSTNAKGSNTTAIWRAYKRGALFANPCFTQIHPTCIPVAGDYQSKLTLMSESLRNDGRVWVPKRKEDCTRPPGEIPDAERDYYLERLYPSFGNLVPRDIASRRAKDMCDQGFGVGPAVGGVRRGVYLDFKASIDRLGKQAIAEMYERITGEDPYTVPMRIYPAIHYTMGGLWVDYNLMSTVEGLFVAGEANFSDHGANRLGASALMQGLADGYFVVPYTIGNYLAKVAPGGLALNHPAVEEVLAGVRGRTQQLLSIGGTQGPDVFHRELGQVMWDNCGMARSQKGLTHALSKIPEIRQRFWSDLKIVGSGEELNQSLEKAGRVADFLELGELMCLDALTREESCGGHFREEHQTEDGEAARHDDLFTHVAAWEFMGDKSPPRRQVEELAFEFVKPSQRSYK